MAEARRENTPLGTLPVLPPIPDWARDVGSGNDDGGDDDVDDGVRP